MSNEIAWDNLTNKYAIKLIMGPFGYACFFLSYATLVSINSMAITLSCRNLLGNTSIFLDMDILNLVKLPFILCPIGKYGRLNKMDSEIDLGTLMKDY